MLIDIGTGLLIAGVEVFWVELPIAIELDGDWLADKFVLTDEPFI